MTDLLWHSRHKYVGALKTKARNDVKYTRVLKFGVDWHDGSF